MMDLKQFLQENMGKEYREDLTTRENVRTLVEEVRMLRKLSIINREYIETLTDWVEDYNDWEDEHESTKNLTEIPIS